MNMKHILLPLLVVLALPMWGQVKRLQRLADVDTTTVATRSYADRYNYQVQGIPTFANLDSIKLSSPNVGAFVEDSSTGRRYRVRADSNAYAIPIAGNKYLELVRPSFEVLDSTDLALPIEYQAGARVAISSGTVYQVVLGDTTGYFLRDDLYLKRENPRLAFRDVDDLKKNSRLVCNGCRVATSDGSIYLVTTEFPRQINPDGSSSNVTEDSITCFSIGPADLPGGNLVTYSNTISAGNSTGYNGIGKFSSTQGHPDPTGGTAASRWTYLEGASNTQFSKSVAFESGKEYTCSFYAKRGEDAFNSDYTMEAELRAVGYQQVNLPVSGWKKFTWTQTANGTTNRINVQLPGIDAGDYFYLYDFQCAEDTVIRKRIATGKRSQPIGDQVYYAQLVPDYEGRVLYRSFKRFAGDPCDRLKYAGDYCGSFPGCNLVGVTEPLFCDSIGSTITVTSPVVFESYRLGRTSDLCCDITVDWRDSTKDIFRFEIGENENGAGLRNIGIKAISPANSAIYIDQVRGGVWQGLTVDGRGDNETNNLNHIMTSRASTIQNTVSNFEFAGANSALDLTGNSWLFFDGRLIDVDTVSKGTAKIDMIKVTVENTGAPVFIVQDEINLIDIKGEGWGKRYQKRNQTVAELGGTRPVFELSGNADVDIFGAKGISGSKDSLDNFYTYWLDMQVGSFAMTGAALQLFEPKGFLRSTGGSSIIIRDARFPGFSSRYDSLHNPKILQTYESQGFDLNQSVEAATETTIHRAKLIDAKIDSALIFDSDVTKPTLLDTTSSDHIALKSSAQQLFANTTVFSASGTWNASQFDRTLNYETGPDGPGGALFVNNGTASIPSRPTLVYNISHSNPPGKYQFSAWVKPTGTYSGDTIYVLDRGEDFDTYAQPIRVDTNNLSYQYVSAVFQVLDSVDTRLNIAFDGMLVGDSVVFANPVLRQFNDSYVYGQTSIKAGYIETSGTRVLNSNVINWDLLDPLRLGGNVEITGTLTSEKYKDIQVLAYNEADTIAVDTIKNTFFISSEVDGRQLKQVQYGTFKNVSGDLSVRLLYYDVSADTYTPLGAATIASATNQTTVSDLTQTVEFGDFISVEVTASDGGGPGVTPANGLSLNLRFQ